jgi:acetyl esterase
MTLDEETSAFITRMAAAGRRPTWELPVAEARQGGALLQRLVGDGPDMHDVLEMSVPSAGGRDVLVRLLVPRTDPCGVAVFLHGGGWVLGNIDQFDTLGRQIAERSGWVVALVDYAKAPEAPFPAGLEDAWSALLAVDTWRGARDDDLRLAVLGDSAGANLAAVCARWAVERGGPQLALQALVCPVTDSGMDTRSYEDPANQLLLTSRSMDWYWGHYLQDAAGRTSPDASPLRAETLSGVAPALVITAEHDVLRDEGEAYAARLDEVGALRELSRYEGQMHGFFSLANVLPGSATAVGQIAATLRQVEEESGQ